MQGDGPRSSALRSPSANTHMQSKDETKTKQTEVSNVNATCATPNQVTQPAQARVAELVGKKCLLKCYLNGYATTALFETGSQVSIVDHNWRKTYLPGHQVRPLDELLGTKPLNVLAVTGTPVPYDGWLDVVLRRKTVLGNIQSVKKIMKTDQSEVTNHTEVNNINTQTRPRTSQSETVEKWDPPVVLAHLEEAQQSIVRKMLFEESLAFAAVTTTWDPSRAYRCL